MSNKQKLVLTNYEDLVAILIISTVLIYYLAVASRIIGSILLALLFVVYLMYSQKRVIVDESHIFILYFLRPFYRKKKIAHSKIVSFEWCSGPPADSSYTVVTYIGDNQSQETARIPTHPGKWKQLVELVKMNNGGIKFLNAPLRSKSSS